MAHDISFADSVPYDFMSVPVALLCSGILFAILSPFVSVLVAAVPFVIFGAIMMYFRWRQREMNKMAEKLPHEVIDNFMLWEENDEIRLGRGSTTLNLEYKGVLESGLLVFRRMSDGMKRTYSARVFRYMDYENVSLKRRKAKSSRTDKVGGNYKEFVESAQEELQSLMNNKIEEETWNHTNSKTSESQKSSQASKIK